MMDRWPRSRAAVRQRKLRGISVAESGSPDNDPLLLLHGIGSAGCSFDAQLAALATDHWCLAPDAPGYGASDDEPNLESMDDYADRWVRLLDDLTIERTDLLGVSWGGVAAARLASRHPARVARLILADSSRGSGIDPSKSAAMKSRVEALQSEGIEAFTATRAPRLLSADAPVDLVERVARTMAASIRLPGYRQAAEAMANTDNTETLRSITVPTLVLVGALDAVTTPNESRVLAELVPQSRLAEIDNAGHLANQEQPDAFNQAVSEFLRSSDFR